MASPQTTGLGNRWQQERAENFRFVPQSVRWVFERIPMLLMLGIAVLGVGWAVYQTVFVWWVAWEATLGGLWAAISALKAVFVMLGAA